jgi:hypothetical protein
MMMIINVVVVVVVFVLVDNCDSQMDAEQRVRVPTLRMKTTKFGSLSYAEMYRKVFEL